jgi:hypothetical protein
MIRFRVARYASSSSWRLTVKMTLSGARRARAAVVHTVAEARVIRVWHAHHPEHSGLAGPSAWYASLSLGFGEAPCTRKKPASAASGAPRPGLPLALVTQWLARRPPGPRPVTVMVRWGRTRGTRVARCQCSRLCVHARPCQAARRPRDRDSESDAAWAGARFLPVCQ